MPTELPTIQLTAPGVYLNDDEFDWSVMKLCPSPPKAGDRKRKSLSYDSENDPKVEQRTLDYLKQIRRSPLKPDKRISDVGVSSPSNTLQVHNSQNPAGLSPRKKRNSENCDDEFKSPAKLAVGENKEKIIPVNKEIELDRLRFSTSPTPQFPTGAEPVRSPRTAVRRLSGAFGRSEGLKFSQY